MIIHRSLVVSLIGGALIIVSVFLPWILWTYSMPDLETRSFSMNGLENNEGEVVLLLGLASIGILFVKQKLFRVGFGLLLAVVILSLIIYFHQRIMSYSLLFPNDMTWNTQFGLYIALIGSLILIAGKLMDLIAKVDEERQLPPSPLPPTPS